MEDEVITIRDLLSELSLAEKFALLARIYWRKATDNHLTRFVLTFCQSVYEWLFSGKSLQEVEQKLDSRHPYDIWMESRSPSRVFGDDLGQRMITPGLYGYANGEVKPMEEFDHPTPADYNMTHTTLADSKNFPEERAEWDRNIVSLWGELVSDKLCSQMELDYWFAQDYQPHAVIEMLKERQRGLAKGHYYIPKTRGTLINVPAATYYTGSTPQTSYYYHLDDERRREEARAFWSET